MIVDDNEQIRKVIRSVLEDSVESFLECADGDDALRAYEEFRPDWVLMDIGMKRVNGITATTLIRGSHPDANIIIVTEYDDTLLKEAARKAGATNYVLKENLSQIQKMIRKPQQEEQ